ncbi:hypothetical protein LEP1GSC133_2629 [Leptospira borgpetersenii serovar Pomona str. 200901868]|uniref:Uncharacterized protein n=1 Tax=Leptospira borgpetersenii serovar Pomona str. 200901868 TaxID=1192866 RepID=M6WH43_LEPBO|nr:hypothetical protein LEP1GSC133_2629 [Leptospira borgpetersenii serovar Pomona str. 200901868]
MRIQPKKPVSKPKEKYLSTILQVFKNVGAPTETVAFVVFSCCLKL